MDGKNKPCHSPGKRRIPWDACRRAGCRQSRGMLPRNLLLRSCFCCWRSPEEHSTRPLGDGVLLSWGLLLGCSSLTLFCSVSQEPAPCPVLGACHGPVAGRAPELLCIPGGCCGMHNYRANLPAVGSVLALLCSQYAETAG